MSKSIICFIITVFGSVYGQLEFFSRAGSAFAGVEMANYTLLAEYGDGLELRLYPARNVVCTTYRAFQVPSRDMFMKLFRYIDGDNEKSAKVDMTAPVSTKVSPTSGGDLRSYEMCFYLPEAIQMDAPKPRNLDVYIKNRPEMKIYTRKVGGYMRSDPVWDQEASDLQVICFSL
ncbi:hypothetical protein QYM36_006812 [Artemia franciscana]|uniref:Uncharacterized protein n=1 Tax=Artemia franciscana TaxID=6661 RepID=A0AA88L854_ARTSF|nr:hypothetical protein QYM36_006812 [Artemia franciscana]